MGFKVDEEFKPDPELKKLYYIYMSILVFLCLAMLISVTATVFLFSTMEIAIIVTLSIFIPFFVIVVFAAYWIEKYYESVSYKLTETDIIVKRGVWWKKVKFVPYNRITNLEIHQGPISRRLRLARISIQTAGYSYGGGHGQAAEASIFGVKNYEEIKEEILKFIRRFRPVAVETVEAKPKTAVTINQQVLGELREIRKILEKILKESKK